MDEPQPKNDSVIVDANFAALDLSYVWYVVKSVPASMKVAWFISFIIICVCKLIRRPVWSPLWGSVEFTWTPVNTDTAARVMTPRAREIESFLADQGFHPLLDYTSPVSFDALISRLFVNPAANTYAILRFSRFEPTGKSGYLSFQTIFEDLRNVVTMDGRSIGLPRYERLLPYCHPNFTPEALLQKHMDHLRSPETAGWKVLSNPSAEQYFEFCVASNPPYFEFLESRGVARRRTKEVAKVVGTPVIPRVCERHPGIQAIARCFSCGKTVCVSCLRRRNRSSYCPECAEAAPQSALTDYLPAGFARRLGAFLMDGLVLTGFWYGIAKLVFNFTPPADTAAGGAIGFACMALGIISISLSPAIYSILLTGRSGMTVGKRITGIKVIADNGQPITYWDAGVRYVGCLLSFLTAGIGFLMPLWDTQKRALHDKFAETRVVRSKPLPIQSQPEEVTYGT